MTLESTLPPNDAFEAFRVPAGEVSARITVLQKRMLSRNIDSALIIQRMDLYYFSGTAQSGYLYVPASGKASLFIRRHLSRAAAESPLPTVRPIKSLADLPELIKAVHGTLPTSIGLEFDVLPVKTYHFLKSLFPGQAIRDVSPLIHRTRMIKSPWEIKQLELTAALSCKIFDHMRSAIRPGLTEIEFSGIIEAFARKSGHGGGLRCRDFLTDLYSWHILSGENGGRLGHLDSPASGSGTSPAFPCGAGYKKLAAGEPIMVDFGTVLNGYHMDETRMFVIGSLPEEALKACRAAISIQQAVLAAVRPGVCLDELFNLAVQTAETLGYGEQFLGPPGRKTSFIGHGVGLELVEPPFIARGKKEKLEPGMVLAIEPKMVFEDRFGAGIESVITVTDTGCRLLSQVPEEIVSVHP
jgi:Xaa-Pro aminopeptidase